LQAMASKSPPRQRGDIRRKKLKRVWVQVPLLICSENQNQAKSLYVQGNSTGV